MNGWSIIFAVTSTISGVWGSSLVQSTAVQSTAVQSTADSTAAMFASILFGFLFLLALCTKAIRGTVC